MADNLSYSDSGEPLDSSKKSGCSRYPNSGDGIRWVCPVEEDFDDMPVSLVTADVRKGPDSGGGISLFNDFETLNVLYGFNKLSGKAVKITIPEYFFNFNLTSNIKAEDYLEEIERYKTYARYQDLKDKPLAIDGARAGFVSLAHFGASSIATDELACLWCGLVIKNLSTVLNMLAIHRSLSRNLCKFLTGEVQNVPLVEQSINSGQADGSTMTVIEGVDDTSSTVSTNVLRVEVDTVDEVDGAAVADSTATVSLRYKNYNQYSQNRLGSNDVPAELQNLLMINTTSMASLGIMEPPLEAGMGIESNRLGSFKTYGNPNINPSLHSTAGWYWTGRGEEMTCFSCGVKCSDWQLDTNPAKRHILINPKCSFVLSNYGLDFINQTLEVEPAYTPPPPQLRIESVQSRATKPRYEYLPFQNLLEHCEIFGMTQREFKEYSWKAVEERIRYGKPDLVRESDILEAIFSDTNFPATNPRQSLQQHVSMPTVVQASRAPQEAEEANRVAESSHQAQTRPNAMEDVEPNSLVSQVRCQICLNKLAEILFVPCTHTVCCTACGMTMKECPMCRSAVTGTIKVNI